MVVELLVLLEREDPTLIPIPTVEVFPMPIPMTSIPSPIASSVLISISVSKVCELEVVAVSDFVKDPAEPSKLLFSTKVATFARESE